MQGFWHPRDLPGWWSLALQHPVNPYPSVKGSLPPRTLETFPKPYGGQHPNPTASLLLQHPRAPSLPSQTLWGRCLQQGTLPALQGPCHPTPQEPPLSYGAVSIPQRPPKPYGDRCWHRVGSLVQLGTLTALWGLCPPTPQGPAKAPWDPCISITLGSPPPRLVSQDSASYGGEGQTIQPPNPAGSLFAAGDSPSSMVPVPSSPGLPNTLRGRLYLPGTSQNLMGTSVGTLWSPCVQQGTLPSL